MAPRTAPRVWKDDELAFLADNYGRLTMGQLLRAARKRFGWWRNADHVYDMARRRGWRKVALRRAATRPLAPELPRTVVVLPSPPAPMFARPAFFDEPDFAKRLMAGR